MAFWGAPVDDALHARHAVVTAMEMQRKLAEINLAFKARSWPQLTIGIGINSGTMTVGDMGSRERKAYTVLGDPVNLADRLEGLTAYYGVGIIIGEAVQKILPDLVCRELDQVRVKGRAGSVRIYQPMGIEGTVSLSVQNELVLWRQALTQYRAQEWGKAETILKRLTASHRIADCIPCISSGSSLYGCSSGSAPGMVFGNSIRANRSTSKSRSRAV
jgi:adenylate cyclase